MRIRPIMAAALIAAAFAGCKPIYAYLFAHELPDDEAGSHDMKGAFHPSELWLWASRNKDNKKTGSNPVFYYFRPRPRRNASESGSLPANCL